jgi:nicotinate phosphoribosyltransferase
LDTYDTRAGARKVVRLRERMRQIGAEISGVRLDSGDLGAQARQVREILDEGGLGGAKITVSGALDEDGIRALVCSGAPVDAFAVGTKVVTSADAPHLDCVYKLAEYDGRPTRKRSDGKVTLPGRKQILRTRDRRGGLAGDIIALEDEDAEGEPLLVEVIRRGSRLSGPEQPGDARARAAEELSALPAHLRSLRPGEPYPVKVSPRLVALSTRADHGAGAAII